MEILCCILFLYVSALTVSRRERGAGKYSLHLIDHLMQIIHLLCEFKDQAPDVAIWFANIIYSTLTVIKWMLLLSI